MPGDQLLQASSLVERSAAPSALDKAPASQRFEGNKHTTDPLALIFVILTFDPAWFHRERGQNLAQELTRPFIKTHDRPERVVRLFVQGQNIFHMPNEIARNFAYTPAFD
jgi:cupin superfamily acireductone dioxygenase involved in methionine salvage